LSNLEPALEPVAVRPPAEPAPPAEPDLPGADADDWRIDELAQRAGIAVDTIRYYQREGLLPTGARSGRTKRYGPAHLERLERIRALQARRFSLAAIRALLDVELPGAVERLLVGEEGVTYDRDELVEQAGVPRSLVRDLTDARVLRDPAEHGRSAYDADDLHLLAAFADLRALAVPDAVLVAVARVFAEGFEEIQNRVAALLSGGGGPHWEPADDERLRSHVGEGMQRIARDLRAIADYTQQRNLQRLLLEKVERTSEARKRSPAGPGATA